MCASIFDSLLVFVLIGLLYDKLTSAEHISNPESTDFLLCRHCGFNVAAGSTVTNVKSPAALGANNQSLFGVDGVLVQTLKNPLGIQFDVVTTRGGTCIGSAQKWQTEHSWFPGHAWKICTCSRCSRFIGWVFEPLQTASAIRSYASPKGFYAIVLDNVISEACKCGFASDSSQNCVVSIVNAIMDTIDLSDEQIDFLAQCEADFANRYTEKDDDFSIVMAIGTSRPPIVEPWRPRGGNQNRPDRRDARGRDRGYKRRYEDEGDHRGYKRRYEDDGDHRGYKRNAEDERNHDRDHSYKRRY